MRNRKILQTIVLIIFMLIVKPLIVSAHNPSGSSILLIEGKNNEWSLKVSAALTAFEYEVNVRYNADSYKSPEEFKKLVTGILSENILVLFNNDSAQLINPHVYLGHETSVIYTVTGVPSDIKTLIVKNNSFKNISRNKSLFMVIKEGITPDQYILTNENDHTAELSFGKQDVIPTASGKEKTGNYLWTLAGIPLIMIAGLALLIKRRINGSGS